MLSDSSDYQPATRLGKRTETNAIAITLPLRTQMIKIIIMLPIRGVELCSIASATFIRLLTCISSPKELINTILCAIAHNQYHHVSRETTETRTKTREQKNGFA